MESGRPARSIDPRIARITSITFQRPTPVSISGVIFAARTSPNRSCIGRPPARGDDGSPGFTPWQAPHAATDSARYLPRCRSSAVRGVSGTTTGETRSKSPKTSRSMPWLYQGDSSSSSATAEDVRRYSRSGFSKYEHATNDSDNTDPKATRHQNLPRLHMHRDLLDAGDRMRMRGVSRIRHTHYRGRIVT